MTPWWSHPWSASGSAAPTGPSDPEPAVRTLVEHAANPAFTPALARFLVLPLTATQLQLLWRATDERLTRPLPAGNQLGLVQLRAATLDRLEAEDPRLFTSWYAALWRGHPAPSGRRGRSPRPAR